ncbi:acyl-CoA N-acyltransferase [Hypoxylon sp. NC1633]|nr:acyl-CoA N-acyltransferase [Hypoxylon sp. NC1633]
MENSWAEVGTTLPCAPLPPNSRRETIRTARLVLRPMRKDDLQAYHELRSQPEAMTGTSLGRPDRNIDETRAALNAFLSPNDSTAFLFGAFLASTGELIGEGGVQTLESSYCGWPEIGFKFRKEFWGQGYATEFLRALLDAWWKLPRSHTRLRVLRPFIHTVGEAEAEAVEQVFAEADALNIGSRRMLEKIGFVQFSEWTEPDTQEHRLGQPLSLIGYKLSATGNNTDNVAQ